jgi:hypothetical protein
MNYHNYAATATVMTVSTIIIDWLCYGLGFESWQRQEILLLFRTSIMALRPLKPPIQLVSGFLPREKAVRL